MGQQRSSLVDVDSCE
jgi:hypothetical protein